MRVFQRVVKGVVDVLTQSVDRLYRQTPVQASPRHLLSENRDSTVSQSSVERRQQMQMLLLRVESLVKRRLRGRAIPRKVQPSTPIVNERVTNISEIDIDLGSREGEELPVDLPFRGL